MGPKKTSVSASQIETVSRNQASQSVSNPADSSAFRRQLSLRVLREKIPSKEVAVAESKRFFNEGASALGRRFNEARVVFGSLSQSFKRNTKRRKPLVESPATPGRTRKSSVDLYSPFGIESPVKRPSVRSSYITPRRRYHDHVVLSERRASLRSAAAYRNGGLDASDVMTPAKTPSKTPSGGSTARRRRRPSCRNQANTPGLTADIEHINEGIKQLRAVAGRISSGSAESNAELTPLR